MGDFALADVKEIEPRWIRIKDAARYSSIGEKRLKSLARAKDNPIVGFPDPTSRRGGKPEWIFDRESLDQYRKMQARVLNPQAVLRRMNLG